MPDILLILIVILILVIVWRGPKTLPQLGNALGRGVREAKEEATKAQAEIQARASGEPTAPSDEAAPTGQAVPTAPPGQPVPTVPPGPDRPA